MEDPTFHLSSDLWQSSALSAPLRWTLLRARCAFVEQCAQQRDLYLLAIAALAPGGGFVSFATRSRTIQAFKERCDRLRTW